MTEKQAIGRIAAYCSKAERCKSDVYKKLYAWELDKETADRIVTLLEKERFINEERFCCSFIKDKLRFNKWGRNKIVFELKKKSIPESLIIASFHAMQDECDFEQSLLRLLTTKEPTIKAKTDFEKRMKLYRFAMGRGYASEQINKCLTKILGNNTDEFFD